MKILPIFLIGIGAGIIDILPMIKIKIDKYYIIFAFIFHLIAPCIPFSVNTPILF